MRCRSAALDGRPDPTHPIQDSVVFVAVVFLFRFLQKLVEYDSVAEPLAGFPITSASILHGTVSLPSRFGCSFCFSSIQPYLS